MAAFSVRLLPNHPVSPSNVCSSCKHFSPIVYKSRPSPFQSLLFFFILTFLATGCSWIVLLAIRHLHCTSGREESFDILRGLDRGNFWLHSYEIYLILFIVDIAFAVAWRRVSILKTRAQTPTTCTTKHWIFYTLGMLCMKASFQISNFKFQHGFGRQMRERAYGVCATRGARKAFMDMFEDPWTPAPKILQALFGWRVE